MRKGTLREAWSWHLRSKIRKITGQSGFLICWNNFVTYQRLILLYYFHQKILKEKTKIFKNYNFFGQTFVLHQVFAYYTYSFSFFDITTCLYIKYACLQKFIHEACIIEWWILRSCIVNSTQPLTLYIPTANKRMFL